MTNDPRRPQRAPEPQETDEELVRMANGSKTENDRYERALREVTEIQRLIDGR